jgi:hypothetical protein
MNNILTIQHKDAKKKTRNLTWPEYGGELASNNTHVHLQVTVAALPPFGGTQIDHLQLNSQIYLTPGFQVLEGYQKLGILPEMISCPGSHFAVLEQITII